MAFDTMQTNQYLQRAFNVMKGGVLENPFDRVSWTAKASLASDATGKRITTLDVGVNATRGGLIVQVQPEGRIAPLGLVLITLTRETLPPLSLTWLIDVIAPPAPAAAPPAEPPSSVTVDDETLAWIGDAVVLVYAPVS